MRPLARLPWSRLLAAVLLCILTFPRIDPETGLSVDGALAWAFNHLFATGLHQGAHIIFPHGPLAFLLYPQALGGDLLAALIGVLGVLLVYHFAMLTLGSSTEPDRGLLHALIAAVLAPFLQVHLQLVAIVGCGLVLHWRGHGRGWLFLALATTLIAVHIRAGIGVMTGALLAMHAVLLLWKRREWRTVALGAMFLVGGAIALRAVLFGHLKGLGDYYLGLAELTRASSAAVGLIVENDWLVISGAIVAFLSIPLLTTDRSVRHLLVLFAPALYAAWKHGMTREDVEHARGLFVFCALLFGLVLLAWRTHRTAPLVAMALTLILGYRALHPTIGYKEFGMAPIGVNRLHAWLFDRGPLAAQAVERSRSTLAQHRLPEALGQRLRQGTVDVYPWDHTYIPANDLHWRPRPVVQSYASYTPWLDRRNAEFFRAGAGADRILWHFEKDRLGGRMASPDDRYLLNDEPQALLAMLDHYTWTRGDEQVAILERSTSEVLGTPRSLGAGAVRWDTWQAVPWTPNGILRAKVGIESTWRRTITDLLYKDAVYTVLYRTEDGSVHAYRFVPDLAEEGLWVAPFIQHPEQDRPEPRVTAIRFTCSEPALVHGTFTLEWEVIPLRDTQRDAASLFGKRTHAAATPVPRSHMGFEDPTPHWHWSGQRTDSLSHTGHSAYRVVPREFTPAYEIGLDSLTTPPTVRGEAWVHSVPGAKGALAIAVRKGDEVIYWEAVDAQNFLFGTGEWWRVVIERVVPTGPGHVLGFYFWNLGEVPVLVDDMAVELVKRGD